MKAEKLYTLFIAVMLLVPAGLFSQETPGSPNELDNIYIPGKNSVFNSDGKNSSSSGSRSGALVENAFKFNPFLLVRGIAALFYERSFSDQIAVQTGLGFCFNKDRVTVFGEEFGDAFSSPVSSISLYSMMINGKFMGPGFFFSGGFRFNWDSYYDYDRQPYFEINTRYTSNAFMISGTEPNSEFGYSVVGTPTAKVKNISLNIIFGTQLTTSGKIQTVHDFYAGVGLRSSSYNVFKIEQRLGPQGYEDVHNMSSVTRESILTPCFMVGYAFGIGF